MSLKNAQTKKKIKPSFLYGFVKVTGAVPALVWLRPKVICATESGKAPKFRNAMLCANHRSMVDPVVVQTVFGLRRLYFLATRDVFRTKLMAWFFTGCNCIPVDKDNFSMDSFHAVCDRLEGGYPVVIFPEGGLNHGREEMAGLKSGVVLMAHKTGSPILPIYLVPVQKWYERRKVVVGDLIDPRSICGDRPSMQELQQVTLLLRKRELEMKALYERQK